MPDSKIIIEDLAGQIKLSMQECDDGKVMKWLNMRDLNYVWAAYIMSSLQECLTWAAENNHVEIVDKLTKDLRVNDMKDCVAIKIAAKAGNLDVIKVLVKNMKDLSRINSGLYGIFMLHKEPQYNDETVVKIAAENKHYDIVEYLFANKKNYGKCCAKFMNDAFECGDEKMAKILIDKELHHKCDDLGRRKNLEYDDKFPLVCEEILFDCFFRNKDVGKEGCVEIVKMLLKRDQRQRNGFFAKKIGDSEIGILNNYERLNRLIDFLIKNKVGLDYVDDASKSLLMYLTEKDDVENVKKLLKNGAKTNNIAKNGDSVFFIAAVNGNMDILQLLINYSFGLYRLKFAEDVYCGQVGSKFDDFVVKFTKDLSQKIAVALKNNNGNSGLPLKLAVKSVAEIYKNYNKIKSIFWDKRMQKIGNDINKLKRRSLYKGSNNLPSELWMIVFKKAYEEISDIFGKEFGFEINLSDDWFEGYGLVQEDIHGVRGAILSKMDEAKIDSFETCFSSRVSNIIDGLCGGESLVDRIKAKQLNLVEFAKDIVIASSRVGKLDKEIRGGVKIEKSGGENVIEDPNGVKGFVSRLLKTSFANDSNEINRLFCSLVCAMEDDRVRDLSLERYIGTDVSVIGRLGEIRDAMVSEVEDLMSRDEELIGKVRLPKSSNAKNALPLVRSGLVRSGFARSASSVDFTKISSAFSDQPPRRSVSLDPQSSVLNLVEETQEKNSVKVMGQLDDVAKEVDEILR